MKALSIKQPWASLIAHGIKDIENRTWKTNFRGRIYIHASAKHSGDLTDILTPKQCTFMTCNVETLPNLKGEEYIKSAIIGEVDIVDCVINYPSIWAEKSLTKPDIEDYRNNIGGNMELYKYNIELWRNSKPIYNWVLDNPVLYEQPILNVKGKPLFFDFLKIENI